MAILMEYLPKTINDEIKERMAQSNTYFSPEIMYKVYHNLITI